MEITREEILNSSEYWQERAETQCYTEGIDCTIQLVDKQQFIDKACEWIEKLMVASGNYDAYDIQENLNDFKQTMKGE